jgi:tetratricopeptide (TPR) repeat protein
MLEVDGDPQACVRAAFHLSYATLDEPAQRLLRLFGLVPGPDLTAPAAAALTGTPPRSASAWLDRLVDAHLVREDSPGRYSVHDLLRCYAVERAEAEETGAERRAALERLYAHYLHHTYAAAEILHPEFVRLPPGGDGSAGFDNLAAASAWLDAERPNLVAAIRHASAHGPRRMAWLLADAMRGYLTSRMDAQDWGTIAEASLAAAQAESDQHGMTAALLSLATLHSVRGRFEEAIDAYQRASDHARRAGWPEAEAHALGSIGGEYQMLGQLRLAATYLSRSLAMRRRLGAALGEANILDNLGLVYWGLGQLRSALDHHTRAAAIFHDLGAVTAGARATAARGIACHTLGRLDDAAEALTAALAVLDETGDRYYLGITRAAIAEVYRDRGDLAGALDLAETAAAFAGEVADPWQQCSALITLASIHHLRGDHRRAVHDFERALALARDVADRFLEADILIRLAAAHHGADRRGITIDLLAEALPLTREGSYRVLEGQAVTVLAAAHLARDRPDAAIDQAERALRIHTETGHRLGAAQAHLVAARAAGAIGHTADANAHEAEAAALFTDIGADPKPHTVALLGEETP